MFKNKIYQYFFLEFFKVFLLVTASISILVWMTQAARLLDLITELGNPTKTYLIYLILSYPKILENTFLLSFLISIFFLLSKLDSSKELSIYWFSGISKKKIYEAILISSLIVIIVNLLLSIYIAPASSLKARMFLGKSKFSLVNALVKEKNFNSPLKGLTIYVDENDKKGNLKNIFIYEKDRTIIASKGRVLNDEDKTYLELTKGFTQEKFNDSINYINFNKTVFDFSKYQSRNTLYPKHTERDIFWVMKNMNNKNISTYKEIREEFNARLIKPFFSLIIALFGCMLLYSNNEKINTLKFRTGVYLLSIFFLILNQALIGFSGKSYYHSIFYAFIIFVEFLSIRLILYRILKI